MSQTPMLGSWSVEVRMVKPFTIHGDLYYELHVVRLDEPTAALHALRVPQHAAAGEPRPGDRLTVSFLMGQVTSLAKAAVDAQGNNAGPGQAE